MQDLIIRPTVLLTIVDHFEHSEGNLSLGVLLGTKKEGRVYCETAFGVPFQVENDSWVLDTSYMRQMTALFQKINDLSIIGVYSTQSLSCIHEVMKYFEKVCYDPVFLQTDMKSQYGQAFRAYKLQNDCLEGIEADIVPDEAEEVGVEHLLSDVQEANSGTLSEDICAITAALCEYDLCLNKIVKYLNKVLKKELPINETILNALQELLNIKPVVNGPYRADLRDLYLSTLTNNLVKLSDLKKDQQPAKLPL